MKTTLGLLGALACGGAVLLAAQQNPEVQTAPAATATGPGNRFVVHEWGTFTSFSGSNSVKLEFRPLLDADLPAFVLDRRRQAGDGSALFMKNWVSAMQRMETPVTYFYSDRPRQVSVRVAFPRGLLTEFYPPVEKMLPEFRMNRRETLSGSSLDWGQVWIVPEDRLQARLDDPKMAQDFERQMRRGIVPPAMGQDHYAYARQTDSALVYVSRETRDSKRPYLPHGAFFEKFLFYRGIGNFDLPLKLNAFEEDRFELHNTGQLPIRSLFLVTVDGPHLRYAKYDAIAPGERLEMWQARESRTADQLGDDMARSLQAAGLYEKEALAMVNTWRNSWYQEQGTRLFYLLPQETTEALLPLTVSPQPDEMLRVMVGRLEIMRPEDEARITALVKQSASDRAKYVRQSDEPPYAFPRAIKDLGRLAEPALLRVKNLTRDPIVHAETSRLLWELRNP